MATIKPFSAIVPSKDKVHLVPSRSYIEYSDEQLKNKLESNPYTFLHIINPDFGSSIQLNDNLVERFKRTRMKFKHFVKSKIFQSPHNNCLYIYQQTKDGVEYTGLIGGASVDEYLSGDIKPHEETLTDRKNIFKDYLEVTQMNAEPVLLSYPDNDSIDQLINRYTEGRPEYEFVSNNDVLHKLWVIDYIDHVNFFKNEFKEHINDVYIADGHHRTASSALLCEHLRSLNPDYTGEENFNYFMAYFIPESQLKISSFSRVVKDLNGLTKDQFLEQLKKDFDIDEILHGPYEPKSKHNFGMCLEGKWYSLYPKEGIFNSNHPVKQLDVSILNNSVLQPILGLEDLKTDKRIVYLGQEYDTENVQEYISEHNYKVGFVLYPISVEQLKLVADTQNVMPPKSTYVEPKLRSGLTIFTITEDQQSND